MTKCCRRCHVVKDASAFSPEKANRDGLKPYCKDCMAARQRERRSDPLKAAQDRATSAAWKRKHPEQAAAHNTSEAKRLYNVRWNRANPERHRAAVDRYQARNPAKLAALNDKRRARKADAPVNDWSAADWREVLEQFNYSCAYCLVSGVPLQQEHMQPLCKGGNHSRDNIVPACAPCNLRKGTKTLIEVLA